MLRLDRLQAGYGGSQVLFDVSLEVGPGEVVTLLGRNGMGKTTTIRAIMGLLPTVGGRIWGGDVRLDGAVVSGQPPHLIAQRGLGLVPEGRQVFPTLTVEENLLATAAHRSGGGTPRWTLDAVYAFFPRLKERRGNAGGKLSGGEQQMVAIGRALMARPRLLCMDEPSMGLSPLYVEMVFDIIKEINKQGVTIFMVEQNASMALSIAHRGYVLQTGVVVLSGDAQDLADNPQIREAYLGEMKMEGADDA